MDGRAALLFFFVVVITFLATHAEGRTKKVVIHIPYKVKKIKHTHTVYKTIHHHHTHHDPHLDALPSEEHEHFHHMHMHVHDDVPSQHSQPVPGIGIPDFLPDVPLEVPIDIPDIPRPEIPPHPNRHMMKPMYRRP